MTYTTLCLVLLLSSILLAQQPKAFESLDIFELEYADNPQISPDGTKIAYIASTEKGRELFMY